MRYVLVMSPRRVAEALLATAFLALGPGCTHNHYYGYDACGTAPTTVLPGTVQYGSVCEVPSKVIGGTPSVVSAPSIVSTPSISAGTPIGARAKPPRVVVSEPLGRGRGHAWRPSDPDSGLATTRVDGALDEPTLTR